MKIPITFLILSAVALYLVRFVSYFFPMYTIGLAALFSIISIIFAIKFVKTKNGTMLLILADVIILLYSAFIFLVVLSLGR